MSRQISRSHAGSAGAETLETRLFEEADIPWDHLAFATVRNALTHYLSDRATGHFGFMSELSIGAVQPLIDKDFSSPPIVATTRSATCFPGTPGVRLA